MLTLRWMQGVFCSMRIRVVAQNRKGSQHRMLLFWQVDAAKGEGRVGGAVRDQNSGNGCLKILPVSETARGG
jgi:hypothetical protein